MRLQACLNGGRPASFHPGVPLTPAALARDAIAVRRAGAESLQLHPRDARGRESLAPADVAAALDAVRAAVPGMPAGVGFGAGAWAAPTGPATAAGRLAAMRAWTVLPDFVSVDLDAADADDVVALMRARGVAVEAGIATRGAARRFASTRLPRYSLRVLVAIADLEPEAARREAAAVLDIVEGGGLRVPVLLHGAGASVWAMVAMAAGRGLAARAGLADGRELPGGAIAAGNAALVAAAARVLG